MRFLNIILTLVSFKVAIACLTSNKPPSLKSRQFTPRLGGVSNSKSPCALYSCVNYDRCIRKACKGVQNCLYAKNDRVCKGLPPYQASLMLNASAVGDLMTIKSLFNNYTDEQLVNETAWYLAHLGHYYTAGRTPLHVAAINNQAQAFEMLWPKFKRTMWWPDENRITPTHWATLANSMKIVNFILKNDQLQLEMAESQFGRTILHLSAEKGYNEMARNLIENWNASVYVRSASTDDRQMPIHLAALHGHLGVVRYFVVNFPELIWVKNARNETALQLANRGSGTHINQVREFLLVSAGGNSSKVWQISPIELASLLKYCHKGALDDIKLMMMSYPTSLLAATTTWQVFDGNSPLHAVAESNQLGALEFLWPVFRRLATSKNMNGLAPVHVAALANSRQIVKFILDKDPLQVELSEQVDGMTILDLAIKKGHLDLVRYLVEEQKAVVRSANLAAEYCHLSVFRYLAERFPDMIDAKSSDGERPIHKASSFGCFDIVDFLLIEVWVETKSEPYGYTPLHHAANQGRLEMVRRLVDNHKANVNAKANKNRYEMQPIHLAAWNGSLRLFRWLVERYPNLIDAVDTEGRKPAFIAAQFGNVAIVQYLLEQQGLAVEGVVSSQCDSTLLHAASSGGQLEMVRYLIEQKGANVTAEFNAMCAKRQAIHLAAIGASQDVVDYLLDKFPALAEAKDSFGNSYLQLLPTSDSN